MLYLLFRRCSPKDILEKEKIKKQSAPRVNLLAIIFTYIPLSWSTLCEGCILSKFKLQENYVGETVQTGWW